ncbi:MAG: alpha-1,2-fucosyltransferase, partial [Thermoanaerobaculia bacterium]
HKDLFRSLFQPGDHIRDWIDEPINRLRRDGKTVVAIHFRAGDYKWLPQFDWTLRAPPQWWVDWLGSVWDELDKPVLYICGNDSSVARKWFGKYNPMTSDDLEVPAPQSVKDAGGSFYRDFYVMSQADVLGISNSTFSFSAAMLNERARLFVRPHWDFSTRFERFDPWDADPLLFLGERPGNVRMKYSEMLRVTRELRGVRAALADALFHYPAGSATVAAMRAKFAYDTRGLRGVIDLLTRPTRGPLPRTTHGST